jgi:glycosyltransferase involved in cell wall biosynthesis
VTTEQSISNTEAVVSPNTSAKSRIVQPVSLLLPCFNAAEFLPAMARSVRDQIQPFSEVILYDDSSRDGSAELARELGFSVIAGRENRGPAFARNRLLEAASAPWVHFQDIDDPIYRTFNAKLSPLLASPECASMCAIRWIGSNGQETRVFRLADANNSTDWVQTFILCPFHLNCFIFPLKFLRSAGGFREDLRVAEDREFIIRLAVKGLKFRYLDEPLVEYVSRTGSTIASVSDRFRWEQELKFFRSTFSILSPAHQRILGDYEIYRSWMNFWDGEIELAKIHSRIANELGFYYDSKTGPIGRMLSEHLGTLTFFALKKFVAKSRALIGTRRLAS